ncbi:MAG: trigger factor [Flavobacteriales bacterium]|jgi:trigger factor|nr:trigger factor [Flavobacteriales bacterium]
MNITLEKVDDLNAILRVEVSAEDYREDVEKLLKQYRKQVNLPGFRSGKTPMGVIRKRFGVGAKAEKINEMTSEGVGKYLSENQVDYLGGPLPKIDETLDWATQEDFVFEYDLGLSPELDIKISKRNKLEYINIVADEANIEDYVKNITERYAKFEQPDAIAKGDMVRAKFVQIDADGKDLEEGISNEGNFMVDDVKNEEVFNQLIDSGEKTRLEIDIEDTFDGEQILKVLEIDETTLDNLENRNFSLTVSMISRMTPAELDAELYEKVYPEAGIETEEAFREKLQEEAKTLHIADSDRKFMDDAVEYLLEKNKFDLPKDFLKKWIAANQKEEVSEEQLEEDYSKSEKYLRWQIIESKLAKAYEIKVEKEEVEAEAKYLVSLQMAQYGQAGIDDSMLDGIVQNVLKDQKELENITQSVFNKKLTTELKDKFKLDEKEMSIADFRDMIEKANAE